MQPQNVPQQQVPQQAVPQAQPVQQVPQGPTQPQKQAAAKSKNVDQNSTQNSLQIAAIRDGIVIMSDGTFRAVVMARSINFDLMSGKEQDAVEYAYQGFLNSLYFDVQIFIRSRKIDMRPYLERLAKVRTEMDNMLLAMLMEDYIYFIDDLVQQTNIMSKEFYVVIPFTSGVDTAKALESSKKLFDGLIGGQKKGTVTVDEAALEKAKTELKNRVQNVANGLIQMGVQAIPLDTQELIELYYNAYNPDTATRQTLSGIDQLTTPMITKGEGRANIPGLGGVA